LHPIKTWFFCIKIETKGRWTTKKTQHLYPLITKHETKEQQAVQVGEEANQVESAYHGLGLGGGAAGPAAASWA
jgi:hypothetical protein